MVKRKEIYLSCKKTLNAIYGATKFCVLVVLQLATERYEKVFQGVTQDKQAAWMSPD